MGYGVASGSSTSTTLSPAYEKPSKLSSGRTSRRTTNNGGARCKVFRRDWETDALALGNLSHCSGQKKLSEVSGTVTNALKLASFPSYAKPVRSDGGQHRIDVEVALLEGEVIEKLWVADSAIRVQVLVREVETIHTTMNYMCSFARCPMYLW